MEVDEGMLPESDRSFLGTHLTLDIDIIRLLARVSAEKDELSTQPKFGGLLYSGTTKGGEY